MKFKINDWKKVSHGDNHTTLRNKEGHELKIFHSKLSPTLRSQLQSLPAALEEKAATKSAPKEAAAARMAKGGPVDTAGGSGNETQSPADAYAQEQQEQGYRQQNEDLQQKRMSDQYQMERLEQQKYAKGGRVKMADGGVPVASSAADSPDQIVQDASIAPMAAATPTDPTTSLDPTIAAKREIYNQAAQAPINQLTPFGPNGEAPGDFSADIWNNVVEPGYAAKKAKETANSAAASADLQAQNKARQSAGLDPIEATEFAQAPKDRFQEADAANQSKLQAAMKASGAPTPGAPADPYGFNSYNDAFMKGAQDKLSGLNNEGAAIGAEGRAQAEAARDAASQQNNQMALYQTSLKKLNDDHDALVHDISSTHINPNQFYEKQDTAGKISTALGLIAGGIGGALTHQGGNVAMDFLNKSIDRDIDAQKADLGKKENLLSVNMKQYGNLRDAVDMTRIQLQTAAAFKMKEAEGNAAGPIAQGRLQQARGDLYMNQIAPQMQQMAMRKALLGGGSGAAAPEQTIRLLVPANEQAAAYKELQTAQNMSSAHDNLLSAFDKIGQVNTTGNRVMSPIQSSKQVATLRDPVLAQLVKDSEGRITPQDTEMIKPLFPSPGDSPETQTIKRAQLNKFVTEKMHFPMLQAYGVNATGMGRFSPQGQSKFTERPPVK